MGEEGVKHAKHGNHYHLTFSLNYGQKKMHYLKKLQKG